MNESNERRGAGIWMFLAVLVTLVPVILMLDLGIRAVRQSDWRPTEATVVKAQDGWFGGRVTCIAYLDFDGSNDPSDLGCSGTSVRIDPDRSLGVGAVLTIWYDPSDERNVTLTPPTDVWLPAGGAFAITLFIVTLWVIEIRSRLSTSAPVRQK